MGLQCLCAASVLFVAMATAHAQQDSPLVTLERVVVTAAGLPVTEVTAHLHASVFDREEISRDGANSLGEFLSRRAGIAIDRAFGSGGFGAMYLRGADPSHVVVLIDGVRQNDQLSSRGSAVDLNTLSLEDVERIEVVRGNTSATHGGALAGVVQVFTRTGDRSSSLSVGAGGRHFRAGSARLGMGPWRLSVSSAEDSRPAHGGRSIVRSANLAMKDRFGDVDVQGQVRAASSKNRGYPDDSGGPAYASSSDLQTREDDTTQANLALVRTLQGAYEIHVQLSGMSRSGDSDTPSVSPGVRDPFGLPAIKSNGRYNSERARVQWRTLAATDGPDMLAAFEQESERAELRSSLFLGVWVPAEFAIGRHTTSITGELRKTVGDWSLRAGARHERVSNYAGQTYPSLSVRYDLGDNAGSIGASWSRARKAPSFYALGHPFVGNPNLRPETSRQGEVFYALPPSSTWEGRVTLFQAAYRDLVDFYAGPPPQLINRSRIESRGLEIDVRRKWANHTHAYANGTALSVRDPDGGTPLRFRPRVQAHVGGGIGLNADWTLGGSLSYVGRRFDSSIPTGDAWLPASTLASVSLNWERQSWMVSCAVDNVLDRRTDETIGTPVGGRRVRVTIQFRV